MIFISIMILIVAIALQSLSPVILSRISAIVFIYAGVLAFNTFYIQAIGSGIGIYSGFFQVSTVSQLFDIFLFFIAGLILIGSPYLNINKIVSNNNSGQYSLIVLFSTLGASLLISSFDLISLYLCIELQSFGVYILATLYRNSESATSAGLKYFLLGSLSSCLILLGTGLVYAYTGLTNLESIYSLVSVSNSITLHPSALVSDGLNLGLIIIIIGLLFKISAAPFHNWGPDVYDDSPTIVTIWLTIMPKISIFIFLLELYTQLESLGLSNWPVGVTVIDTLNSGYVLKNILLLSSLLSLIIGTIVGLAQSKIKRLLAYSTISHVGFMLLAIAINTEQSIDSLLFYIIQYSLTNLDTFLIILALGYIINSSKLINNNFINNNKGKELDIKFISELKGQFFSNPLLSISLTICLFSMAGIPPLLGFFSKQFVLYSAIQSGYYFMSIVCIIVSVISASYYLKIIKVLHSHSPVTPGVRVTDVLPLSLDNREGADNQILIKNFDLNSAVQHHSVYNPFPLVIREEEYNGPKVGLEAGNKVLSNFHSFLISTLTLSILFFVLKPSILLNSTTLLSLSLFYY